MSFRLLGRVAAALFALSASAPGLAADAESATPPMWRVQDADTEVFLLGTFHILPPDLKWRSDALAAAFEAADTVYFEVEADAPDAQSKTLAVVMQEGFNPPGKSLTDLLDEDEAQKLREITASLGLPFAGVEPMRPWQAFLTLSVQFIIKRGFAPGAGVDSALLADARTFGKELRFFETIEAQLGLFTNLEPETELSLLSLTIQDWENQAESFDALFAAWRAGDVAYIDEQMNGVMRDKARVVFDRLIVARNEAWAEDVAAAMRAGNETLLVAVGAAHLAGGEYSLPALLKAEGFEVTRYGVYESNAASPATDDNAPELKHNDDDEIGEILQSVDE